MGEKFWQLNIHITPDQKEYLELRVCELSKAINMKITLQGYAKSLLFPIGWENEIKKSVSPDN